MMPILETERLIIKAGTIEEYVIVHEYDFNYLMNIDGVFEYIKRDPNEVRGWFSSSIETFYKEIKTKNHYNFIVYLKNQEVPIGNISFDRNIEKIKSTEVACYLHPTYWGNAYTKEALIKCMEYLFNNGFKNIIYGYDEGNDKSQKLCKKLGFESYKQIEEANYLGNISTTYKTIMSKEKFYQLYPNISNKSRVQ